MMKVNKYTVEEFKVRYAGKRHISCGIHYEDGKMETMVNVSCSQIISVISDKKVSYIVSK